MVEERRPDAVGELIRRLDGPVAPDPAFAADLRRRWRTELELGGSPDREDAAMLDGAVTVGRNGLAPGFGATAPRSRPRLAAWPRRRRFALERLAAAVLVAAVIAGSIVGAGGLPAFLAFWQDDGAPTDGDVPMLGANPGRTGEQPEPGPDDEPGVRWSVYAGVGVTSPVVVDGVVYLAGDSASLSAYDVETGAERWRTRLAGNASDPTIVDGRIYVGIVRDSESANSAGFVEAYDAATGDQVWSVPTGSFGGASPVVVDGVVYGMGDAEVFAFDAETGDQRWHRVLPTGACGCTPPGVAVAGGEVFAPGGGVLYAFDAETGQERWQFATEADWVTMPVVADGVVFVGAGYWPGGKPDGEAGAVHAVDAATGERVWTAVAVEAASPPAVVGGRVYVPTLGSGPFGDPLATPEAEANVLPAQLVALDAATGRFQWALPLPAPASQPAVADDTVYVAAHSYGEGFLAAVEAATGEERWRLEPRGSVVASPAVVGGSVYVTTYHNGVLYALAEGGTATPVAGDETLLGPPCEPGPRDAPAAAPVGTPSAGLDPALVADWPLYEADLPSGPAAPAEAVAGIERTVQGLAFCGDADLAAQATFYSDDFFRRFFALVEGEPTVEEALIGAWEVSPFAPIVVRDARQLPNGRIGAVVEGGSNKAFMAFVPAGDAWLIDEVVLLVPDDYRPATPEA